MGKVTVSLVEIYVRPVYKKGKNGELKLIKEGYWKPVKIKDPFNKKIKYPTLREAMKTMR